MIIEEKLQSIVLKLQREGTSPLYIRSAVKEYLQSYVLNFIYAESTYGKILIFTGGTCLRKVYGINRLSEDLDFDSVEEFNPKKFAEALVNYFQKRLLFKAMTASVRQQGRQILLKFDLLGKLGLAKGQESPMVYVKVDISASKSSINKIDTKLLNDFDFSYIAKSYDLGTLMTGKIMAILFRNLLWGNENKETIKGRDYFDLLWFLEKKVIPNYDRALDLVRREAVVGINSKEELMAKLNEKVLLATGKFKEDFKRDLTPFIANSKVVEGFVDSYLENYYKESKYLGF